MLIKFIQNFFQFFSFPRNLWKVGQIREKAKMFITQGNQNTINDLKKSLYIKAKECMNVFEVQLKKKNFIFGKPSTIDAVIYGYLALLSKAPFSSLELKVFHLFLIILCFSNCFKIKF